MYGSKSTGEKYFATNKYTVTILVDNNDRDLPGLCLLAVELLCNNCEVALLETTNQHEFFFNPTNLIVVNYVRKNNLSFLKHVVHGGTKVLVLETEGGVIQAGYEWFAEKVEYARPLCHRFCLWGTGPEKVLQKKLLRSYDFVKTTGHPSTDLYCKPWNDLHASKTTSRQKSILIATGGTVAFPRYATRESERETIHKINGLSHSQIDEIIKTQTQCREDQYKLIGHIKKSIPGAQIILRPHPFEDYSELESAFCTDPDVKISKGKSIIEDLRDSFAHVHYASSTAIEARIFGIETIEMSWLKNPSTQQAVCSRISVEAGSVEEITEIIKQMKQNKWVSDEKLADEVHSIIEECFLATDGRSSHRIANECMKLLESNEGVKESYPHMVNFDYQRDFKQHLVIFACRFLGTDVFRRLLAFMRGNRSRQKPCLQLGQIQRNVNSFFALKQGDKKQIFVERKKRLSLSWILGFRSTPVSIQIKR